MTLTSELTKVSYAGNDSTTVFAVTFAYWVNADLRVILVASDGTETVQTGGGVHYSLTGGAGSTGSLTMITPPATGETLIIKSDKDDIQDTELPVGGAFPSQSVEQQFDILTRLIQQKEERWSRSFLLKESTTLSDLEFPSPGALGYVRWNAAGTALETVAGISQGQLLQDADGDTKIDVEESADEDIIRFDAGGIEVVTLTASAINLLQNVAVTGNITVSGTVDGRDVAADGAKLDGIEALADVTDTANVTAAGALMDSEVDADIKTLTLPANTTISAFGATLVDDASASAALTTLGAAPLASPTFTGTVTAPEFRATATGYEVANLVAASATDLSKHLRLYDTTFGFNITSGTMNWVSAGANVLSATSTAVALKVAMTTTSTIDGRDVATDGAKLDGIEALADVTDATNVDAAGAVMESDYINNAIRYKNSVGTMANVSFATNSVLVRQTGNIGNLLIGASELLGRASTGNVRNLTGAEVRTILNVEDGADVTDATNVNAAGAVMESDFTNSAMRYKSSVGTMTDLPVANSRIVGRKSTGEISALTASEMMTILSASGNTANFTLSGQTRIYNASLTDPTLEFLDSAGTQNWYMGINEADSSHLYIGRGADPDQGITPAMIFKVATDDVEIPAGNLDVSAGSITLSGTVDGRDVAADGTKLDGIESGADVTDATNVNAAGAVMESDFGAANTLIRKNSVSTVDTFIVADNTIIGRDASTGSSEIQDLTKAEVLTLLNVADGAIANVVEDTTPQLGGNLDTNSNNIQFDTAHGIWDDAGNDFLLFNKTAAAVNHLEITNSITSVAPSLTAAGNDVNVDLTLDGKGSGVVKTLSSDLDITGSIVVSGTVDGRDVATDGTKLDGIESGADVTDTANVTAAGALMDSEVDADIKTLSLPASTTISTFGASLIDDATAAAARTTLGLVIGTDVQAYSAVLAATTASFLTADETKLDGIETGADVTDTTNVTAAGALMDSEVDADLKTLVLPANTTISTFGASLIDDTTAAAARTTLGITGTGGSMILLETQIAAADATIDMETTLDGTYTTYLLIISGARPATDQVSAWIRMKDTTYQSDATDYAYWNQGGHNGSAVTFTSNTAAQILCSSSTSSDQVGNATNESYNAYMYIYAPADAGFMTCIEGHHTYLATDSALTTMHFGGKYNTAAAITGIRFMFSSGNVAEGTFSLYGVL